MENSNFDRLLERYVNNQLSPDEKEKLELWLEIRKTRDEVNIDMTSEEEELLFQKISSATIAKEEVAEFRPAKAKHLRISNWSIGIAATVTLVVTSSLLLWYFKADGPGTHSFQASNKTEKVILNDGSIAWLKGQSTIAYFDQPAASERHATLNGQGLFEIAKNPDKPFILQCGAFTVKVLGTSFTLKASNDTLMVNVLTGKVNISSASNPDGVNILPNESVAYTTKGVTSSSKLSASQIEQLVAGTEYSMNFENERLSKVMSFVSEKFNVSFQFKNEKLKNCLVTGDFTDHSLASTIEMISEAVGATFVSKNEIIQIDGAGCE